MYYLVIIVNNITGDNMKVKDIMSKNIITCNSNSNIYDIAKLMKEKNIGFIPIVDNKLIGVITDRDIVINVIYNKDDTIKPYIKQNIISIDEQENIDTALNLMSKNKIKRLVVMKDDHLIGILSISDILNSKTSDNKLIKTFRTIYQLNDNQQNTNPEVDEFYL